MPIDLRSDTVTRPTAAMRQAIAGAEVGDDVLGDDPTVLRLQQRCAELLGKEAALFVPSGSMANQVAIRSVCEPGDELIIDDTTHSYNYETGGPAALSGCSMRIIRSERGVFTAADVQACLRPVGDHFPNSQMVIVENTSNRGGGSVWPFENIAAIQELCRRRGLHLHMDGARLMNACTARGCKPTDFTRLVDSVSMCFSKGLGAPVGSIVAGTKPFIARCNRFRKMFGGAMRQAGILAAAALHALDHHVERLADDHTNARRFAEGIAGLPGVRVDLGRVETNIVLFDVAAPWSSGAEFAAALRERGVWMFDTGPSRVRAVTHLDVTREQIDQAVGVIRELCKSRAA